MKSPARALARVLFGSVVLALLVVLGSLRPANVTAAVHPSPDPAQVALTIDDLPATAELPAGYTRRRLIAELIATLQKHHVTHVTGFVIGQRALATADARAALSLWTHAGFEVGNHTWSHASLAARSARSYIADIRRMEPLMRRLERETGQTVRYFRYPYLEEGEQAAARKQVLAAVAALGYRNARVSLDFADWAWAEPTMRCLSRRDPQRLQTLQRSYLEFANTSLLASERVAHEVIGHPLVQVLLLHANVATAQNLDALLSLYERAGVQFVSLAEALRDPIYDAQLDTGLGNALTTASAARGYKAPASLEPPLALLEQTCR